MNREEADWFERVFTLREIFLRCIRASSESHKPHPAIPCNLENDLFLEIWEDGFRKGYEQMASKIQAQITPCMPHLFDEDTERRYQALNRVILDRESRSNEERTQGF